MPQPKRVPLPPARGSQQRPSPTPRTNHAPAPVAAPLEEGLSLAQQDRRNKLKRTPGVFVRAVVPSVLATLAGAGIGTAIFDHNHHTPEQYTVPEFGGDTSPNPVPQPRGTLEPRPPKAPNIIEVKLGEIMVMPVCVNRTIDEDGTVVFDPIVDQLVNRPGEVYPVDIEYDEDKAIVHRPSAPEKYEIKNLRGQRESMAGTIGTCVEKELRLVRIDNTLVFAEEGAVVPSSLPPAAGGAPEQLANYPSPFK